MRERVTARLAPAGTEQLRVSPLITLLDAELVGMNSVIPAVVREVTRASATSPRLVTLPIRVLGKTTALEDALRKGSATRNSSRHETGEGRRSNQEKRHGD